MEKFFPVEKIEHMENLFLLNIQMLLILMISQEKLLYIAVMSI
jgi:hypothetical protein